jgi:hypothetical protein
MGLNSGLDFGPRRTKYGAIVSMPAMIERSLIALDHVAEQHVSLAVEAD